MNISKPKKKATHVYIADENAIIILDFKGGYVTQRWTT